MLNQVDVLRTLQKSSEKQTFCVRISVDVDP